MDYVRRSEERGKANFGWLDSRHTFSFGNYYDPQHMGISVLRVINDDTVIGGTGFDTHGHRDMEIISYVLDGTIEHKDSMGNQFTVTQGEVQRMSAGSGILHSEYNHSATQPLRFLQIWIQPNVRGIKPSYEQAKIKQRNTLTPLVTPNGQEGSLMMHQDAWLYRLRLAPNETMRLSTKNRTGYLHIIRGQALLADQQFTSGDGLGNFSQTPLNLTTGKEGLEGLWFDLPR